MSIRRRILRTYLVLIVIVLVYIALSFFLSSFRLRMEKDKNAILEVKILWDEMLVYMNESVNNWDDGATFDRFILGTGHFEDELYALVEGSGTGIWYRGKINSYLKNLYDVWVLAKVNVDRIQQTRDGPAFHHVEDILETEPGLQRLYSVYMRLLNGSEQQASEYAYALKEYIDAVEFFPIYSDTVNRLFVIVREIMETQYRRLQALQNYLSAAFFLLFLAGFALVSGHFTNSLSRPITDVSQKLDSFIGKSMEHSSKGSGDELETLESSVENLIEHYTHLSRLARRLSSGRIETSLLSLPRQGVVGNALKEVAAYLKELATVADWIREGRYGSQVQEKSDQDVLARSFNIMSREIAEKILTLTNMFETIDEGILLIDMHGTPLEANQRFLGLLGVEDLVRLKDADPLHLLAGDDQDLLESLRTGQRVSNHYGELRTTDGECVPVRVSARPLLEASGDRTGVMVLVSNESVQVRMRREQEKLEAQATEAELRALRAQINPHFFFNTLNTIAHLIETDSSQAVGMVEKLAGLFRHTLLSTKRATVTLSEEILHIREFLEIERARHGDRLDVTFDIDREAEDAEIPPMLLQPIVENGIKYGTDREGRIRVLLNARVRENDLTIEVSDCGTQTVDHEKLLNNARTGLKNVNQRLLTVYRTNLEFESAASGGLIVRFRIPLSKGDV